MNIIITGASSGVGFEAVIELIMNTSSQVLALARSEDKLQNLYETALTQNPDCTLYVLKFDIVHGDYMEVLVPFVEERMGKIDILINNAGSLLNKPFNDLSQLDFVEMLQNNFLGHVKIIQNMLPLMNAGGHIVNIGSMGGYKGSIKFPGLAAYSASKGALHTLTECLAAELTESKIAVNCLALGSAQTEMLAKAFPGYASPVNAYQMGKFIADFALNGHKVFNGKVLPVSVTAP